MNKLVVVMAFVGIGCGGGVEPVGQTEEAAKACPFLIPFCPEDCHLDNACPAKCHCPEGFTQCGDNNFCNPQQTCCVGQPFPVPTCINGDICPISRREYKTDISYLGARERSTLAADLMKFRLATYRYKPGVADGESHLGFIIDDVAPSPAVAPTGSHVDLYGYTTMAVAALQQQQAQIAQLQKEVAALRTELARKHR
jgi:hypothetical protein